MKGNAFITLKFCTISLKKAHLRAVAASRKVRLAGDERFITARILRDQCRALRDSILHDQVFRDRCRDLRDQVLRTPVPAGQSGISQALNEGDGVYRP